MSNKILTASLIGLNGHLIEVECDVSAGMPSFDIVGLPDAAVKEAKERIKSALKHSSSQLYKKQIVVNLAPASLKKEGSLFDFPMALAIMASDVAFNDTLVKSSVFIGELSLTGELRAVDGVLPIVISAYENGIKNVFVPMENAKEASIVEGINVYGIEHFMEAFEFLVGRRKIAPYVHTENYIDDTIESFSLDFSDVKGQDNVKRALLVAAAGGHNILMVGAPGSGKTMIAQRIPTILPDLTFEESLEVTKVYSVAGLISSDNPLVSKPPYRQIHHTISTVGITGGGRIPKPGELSLSHRGILFLDELPEFRRDALETLRQPLEDGNITVTRVSGSATYPCNVMIVCSMNPCPCGYYGSSAKPCTCTDNQIKSYLKKISGPLLDRIDIHIEVGGVDYEDLSSEKSEIDSATLKEQVLNARKIQSKRYKKYNFLLNSEIPSGLMDELLPLGIAEKELMKNAYESLGLSARAHARILKVARSIADLDGKDDIQVSHLAEAIQYRSLDKKYWG